MPGCESEIGDHREHHDNHASNRISEAIGYLPNGVTWDTRRGEPAQIKRWRLTREQWLKQRRDDIELVAVADCLPVLGIDPPPQN